MIWEVRQRGVSFFMYELYFQVYLITLPDIVCIGKRWYNNI